MKPATELIHRPEGSVRESAAPLTTPIYETTTFVFENAAQVKEYNEGRGSKFLYSRYTNPTVMEVETKIAALEGAESALVLSSGQAATVTALLALTSSGDEIVCSSAIYGGTLHLIGDLLPKFGISSRFVSIDELREPDKLISSRTRLLWFESPINPTLRCVDVAKVAAACRSRNVVCAIDNTFASPINQQPIALGVDLVMHSATKYLNGHSDVVGGCVIAADAALADELKWWGNALGVTGAPFDSYLTLRGLRTLEVRMRQHERNAAAVVEVLCAHPAVRRVYYPGLETHPGHAIAARQQQGYGAMVSFELAGDTRHVRAFLDGLECFSLAESLGGMESLIAHPATMTHAAMDPEARRRAGIGDALLRLSVGIEGIEDLLRDLERALERAAPRVESLRVSR